MPATDRTAARPRRRAPLLQRLARALMGAAALALPVQGALAQMQGSMQAAAARAPEPASGVRLPALGESAAEDFTVGTERRLGDQIMGEIRRDPDYLDDPVLLDYLQSLWRPLVKAAQQRGDLDLDTGSQFAWEAFLVRDRSVNAFALPGGFVGVHLGLIAMTATRDELASVLAHELTHVTQRHIARSIANQQRQSMLAVAGMILALLAASRSNNIDMANAALMGGQAAALQGQLNFSRDMEREADRVGFAVLGQAGFDPAGMAGMFEKLDRANHLNDSGAYPYLRSHPLTLERQSEARLRIQASGGPRPTDSALHLLMAARARVLMDASAASLRRLQEPALGRAGQTAGDRVAALYASALASSLLRDQAGAQRRAAEARALLAQQAAAGRADPAVDQVLQIFDAEQRLAAGDAAGARAALGAMSGGQPGEGQARAVLMLQAHAALQTAGAERPAALREVTQALQTWVTAQPRDASAWMLLGQTAEAQGDRLRALRAQAESRWLLGDLTGAIDRLRAGRNFSRNARAGQDFIEASIIDARLRELEGVRRQAQAEARGAGGGRGGERGPDRGGPERDEPSDVRPTDRPADSPASGAPASPSPQSLAAASTAAK